MLLARLGRDGVPAKLGIGDRGGYIWMVTSVLFIPFGALGTGHY